MIDQPSSRTGSGEVRLPQQPGSSLGQVGGNHMFCALTWPTFQPHASHSHGSKMGKRAKLVGLPLISLSEIRSCNGANDGTSLASADTKLVTVTPATPGCSVPATPGFRPNDLEADRDNRPWLAARGDAAICNFTRKARRPQANVWSSEQCQQALADLRRDYAATSSKGPNASLVRTWEAMHRRMNQGRCDYYPLTCAKITKVAAAFKACGYRSFANYLSRAKEIHISYGGVWTDELVMEGRRAVRSWFIRKVVRWNSNLW